MIESSLAYALVLVSSVIQARVLSRLRSSLRMLRTISRARALASGVKFFLTYACPRISPMAPSVSLRQRFQRGRISATPWSTVELKRKLSLTKGELKAGAVLASRFHRR